MAKSPARALYEACDQARPIPPAVLAARLMADNAWEDLNDMCKAAEIILPGDDRAEKIVTDIFAYIVEAAGLDPVMLGNTVAEVG